MMFGLIYKISNDNDSVVYIGSTTQSLAKRWGQHVSAYNSWISGSMQSCISIYPYFERDGIDAYSIQLLDTTQYQELWQLRKREQQHIDIYRRDSECKCVNAVNAYSGGTYLGEPHNIRMIKRQNRPKKNTNRSRKPLIGAMGLPLEEM